MALFGKSCAEWCPCRDQERVPEPVKTASEARLDHLEGRINAAEAINNNRNDRTQDRLCKLEARTANLEKAVYACDSSALKEPITAKDIDRWRAIEKAARKALWEAHLVDNIYQVPGLLGDQLWKELANK